MIRHLHLLLFACALQIKINGELQEQEVKPNVPLFRRKCTAISTNDGWYNVHCVHCEFTGMPPELPKLTRSLDMSYNNIDEVRANSFSPVLHNLQKLNISHNFIHTIDDSAFIGVIGNTIQVLDLSYNQLRTLPNFLPNSLKVLKLSHNEFQSFYLFDIAYLYTLKILHLDNNQIRLLETRPAINTCDVIEVFLKQTKSPNSKSFVLPMLDYLDISNNKLKQLPPPVIRALPSLTYIRVRHNMLTSISNRTFISKGFCILKFIDLSYNNIRNLGKDTFRKCPLLKYLSLSHNRLEAFPQGLNVLEWLDVSFNQIKHINIETKSSLYPQEIMLLGGNPFHCDCRLKWLKELFDTREYMLRYLTVDHQYFVPACASPENLVGEFWDVLSSDMFYCVHDDSDPDLELPEGKVKTLSTKIEIDLVHVESITTGIRLMWDCGKKCDLITAFLVKYRLFGRKEFHVSVPITATTRTYTLHNLRSNTAYVICLSAYVVEGEADDACLEVITQSKQKMLIQMLSSFISNSLVYIIIIAISCVIVYQFT